MMLRGCWVCVCCGLCLCFVCLRLLCVCVFVLCVVLVLWFVFADFCVCCFLLHVCFVFSMRKSGADVADADVSADASARAPERQSARCQSARVPERHSARAPERQSARAPAPKQVSSALHWWFLCVCFVFLYFVFQCLLVCDTTRRRKCNPAPRILGHPNKPLSDNLGTRR